MNRLLFAGDYSASSLKDIIDTFKRTIGWKWKFIYIGTFKGEKQYHLIEVIK